MMGSSRRRQRPKRAPTMGQRRQDREKQDPTIRRAFEVLNAAQRELHDRKTREVLEQLRRRIVAIEKKASAGHGVWAQLERVAARATAVAGLLLVSPLLAYWKAAGYPQPGAVFWTDDAVVPK